jgi:acyl-coenzyme A thioesterase PaaI-like protein
MSFDDIPAGAALPDFHVSAPAPAEPHENKIHEDDLARQYGFKGGLVPGVIMYAWMTHPVVEALGAEWLERGSFETRFAKPIYYEEPATIRARVSARTAEVVTIEVAAHNSVGEVCGTATMSLDRSARPSPPVVADYAVAPLPAERPRATRALFEGLRVLGTPELDLDVAASAGFVTRFGETLGGYAGADAMGHPGMHLDMANRALDRNVRMSPWIHVGSAGRHLSAARVGDRLAMRGRVQRLFEKKGHEFVEADLLLVANGSRPVASIRHTAIYLLRKAG